MTMRSRIVALAVAATTVALASCSAPHDPSSPSSGKTETSTHTKVGDDLTVKGVPDAWGTATVTKGSTSAAIPSEVDFSVPGYALITNQHYAYGRGCTEVSDLTPDGITLLGIQVKNSAIAPFEERGDEHAPVADLVCVPIEQGPGHESFTALDAAQGKALASPIRVHAFVYADQVVDDDE